MLSFIKSQMLIKGFFLFLSSWSLQCFSCHDDNCIFKFDNQGKVNLHETVCVCLSNCLSLTFFSNLLPPPSTLVLALFVPLLLVRRGIAGLQHRGGLVVSVRRRAASHAAVPSGITTERLLSLNESLPSALSLNRAGFCLRR